MEVEDGDDSQLIQHQLTQEQPGDVEDEEEEDDDDDGAVNLFLPDIVEIVNKAASTPSKPRAQPSHRPSSAPRISPIAAARQHSSPRSQIEVTTTQDTESTQSSSQSEELSHFKNYLKKTQQAKTQQAKTKSSPLRRPSSRSKPLSRSSTPIEAYAEGKPDPFEFPSSPEVEVRPAPVEQPAAEKETNESRAGGKRKRKESAPVERSVTLEEPVVGKRPRRGQDKPQYSPSSLGKATRSHRGQEAAQEKSSEPLGKCGRGRPKKAVDVKIEEQPEETEGQSDEPDEVEEEEEMVPVDSLPAKRARSSQAELDAETPAAFSSVQKPRSLRFKCSEASNAIIGSSSSRFANRKCAKCYATESTHWHTQLFNEEPNGKYYCHNCHSKDYKKKSQSSGEKTQPEKQRQMGLDLVQSSVSTFSKSIKDKAVTQVAGTQSQPPKSAHAAYQYKLQQDAVEEEEREPEVEASSPIPETPNKRRGAKSSSVAPQSASPRVLRKPRQHFKDTTSPVAEPEPKAASEPSGRRAQLRKEPEKMNQAAKMKLGRAERHARREEEQEESLAAEAEKVHKKKAKKAKQSADVVRVTKSNRPNGDGKLDRIVESDEPETANFNMEGVPESLFNGEEEEEILMEGDCEEAEVDGQAQPALDEDSPWDENMEEEDEGEDEESEEEPGEGGVGGLSSILMDPSPKKPPSQKIAVPQRQSRAQEQKLANGNRRQATAYREPRRSPSPPSAQDDEESGSVESQRKESPARDYDTQTTMDYGRNPFKEPTFNFDQDFPAKSRCFLKDMPVDSDVLKLFELTKELQATTAGVDRQTQHARDIAKIRRYLVGDYKSMKEQHDDESPDEDVICDLYANVYTNTRKLHKKINALIDEDLAEDSEDISNGEKVTRDKSRKGLLRDVYLFIVPDLLRLVTAMITTYCANGSPGIYSFEELHGLVRLTLDLLRTADDETNSAHRPKQLPRKDIDYQYPKFKILMKALNDINESCRTILDQQAAYERELQRMRQRKTEAKKKELERQRALELSLREREETKRRKEEEEAEEQRIAKEKLAAWYARNASILQKYKDQPVPRQVTQLGFSSSQLQSRRDSVDDNPFEQDIRNVQPIINGRQQPHKTQSQVDNRSVEVRRKPIVSAARRKVPWAQNQTQRIVRPHALPMSNDDSDDDVAFDPPQEPRRRVVHYPVIASEDIETADDDKAFMAMDLDDEVENWPVHPIARGVPRARIEEEELSLTQRRLNEEQKIKVLKAELEDLEKTERKKKEALEEMERRKRELEITEREFYEWRDYLDVQDEDLGPGEMQEEAYAQGEEEYQEDEEEGYDYAEEEDDQSVAVGTSFPGNNNRMTLVKPWTHDDLSQLIKCLKFYCKSSFSPQHTPVIHLSCVVY